MEETANPMSYEKLQRPETPSIDIVAIRSIGDVKGVASKNFSALFKQIVEYDNKNFLEGDVNMIDYLISKYTNTSLKEVSNLRKIHIKINAEYNLLNQFGERLSFLKELKLTGSNIPSISDIGSNYRNLVLLNMDNCNLSDLTGIVCFRSLESFSAKYNKLSDLFEIEALSSSLKTLLLDNNKIEEAENITFLSTLEKLQVLSLLNNPIIQKDNYRQLIYSSIPWLQSLDTVQEDTCSQVISQAIEPPLKGFKGNSQLNLKSIKKSPIKLSNADKEKLIHIVSESKNHDKEGSVEKSNFVSSNDNFSMTNKHIPSSQATVKTDSFLQNSLRSSTVIIKATNNTNTLSFSVSNNGSVLQIPSGSARPRKLKEQQEKEQLKMVFAAHKEFLDSDQEKEDIIKKIDKLKNLTSV